jgi:hypothetical protein
MLCTTQQKTRCTVSLLQVAAHLPCILKPTEFGLRPACAGLLAVFRVCVWTTALHFPMWFYIFSPVNKYR